MISSICLSKFVSTTCLTGSASYQAIISSAPREKGIVAAKSGGTIVLIASLLSFQGGITVPGYAESKEGVKQLTMAFANEWASKGVTVMQLGQDTLLQITLTP
jgi:NAD(P)-dependent dehydrogenase (short-subunit alcohol dehydrogenase family)